MSDWSESVPFIKEVDDRSQLTRAGIAKTTTNERVRTRDNQDTSGISPSGFTTFVQPKQLPLLLSTDASITITETPRAGTDDGTGNVTDYDLAVNFPALPEVPDDTDDINYSDEAEIAGYNESNTAVSICDPSFGSSQSSLINPTLTALLDAMNAGIKEIAQALDKVKNAACDTQVALGDVLMTVVPPVNWSDSWAEPRGQLLAVVDYPDLYALFGNEYGGTAPTTFALPNLSDDYYIRTKNSTAGLANITGGSNTYNLSQVNIPLHTHTFSGTTNTDGAHTHPIPTRNSPGNADACRNADPADDSFNLASSGAHNHSFNGTTDAYGQDPVTPITVEPRYTGVYLKMRIQ